MFKQLLRNAKQRLRLFLSECGRRARVLRDSLRQQPDRIDPSSRFVRGLHYGYWEREARGLELLKEWLSPERFAQYAAKSYFEVTGCHSGKRYRISHGTSTSTSSTAPAARVLAGVLRPKVTSSQATSCWHRKLRWRPTSVVRWPWRTDFLCQQADEICISITELVIDFIEPDGRAHFARTGSPSSSAAKHQSATKLDPGGVERHPDDVALDRKIGSICRGC